MLGLVGVAVAALVNVAREGPHGEPVRAATTAQTDQEPPGRTDPDSLQEELPNLVPLPAELREAGGMLWWSTPECEAGYLEISSGAVTRLRGDRCRIWPAPDGGAAVALVSSPSDPLEGHGLEYVAPTQAVQRAVSHTPGVIASEVAWDPESLRFALCLGTRTGTVVDIYHSAPGGHEGREGVCFPAWLGDGGLALADAGGVSVRVDDRLLLGLKAAAEILPSVPEGAARRVSALGARGDRLVVGLAVVSPARPRPLSSAVALLAPDGDVEFQAWLAPQGSLPTAVGLSPAGDALWYFDATGGRTVVLSVPGGRRLSPFPARWISWSPDGRYVAAATVGGLSVLRWPDGERLAVVPVDAATVAWTGSP